jgi:hypothetical protein
MTPQEQARYEGLFPNYTQPDGFVHGKEAVELFSKSNIPKDTLGKIWNMVDAPGRQQVGQARIRNGHASHCLYLKKNLPLPSGLPISLKILKSQQPGAVPPMAAPVIQEAPSIVPPPELKPIQQQYSAPPSPSIQQRYSTPPLILPQGAGSMNISDAFEGLNPASAARGYDEPVSFDPPSVPSMGMGYMGAASSMPERTVETIPEPEPIPEPTYTPVPAPAPAKTSQQLASSYNMGDDITELGKLKITLQKLQAENIALPAQMHNMTEEERAVHKETAATIAEIGRLSTELTDVRAEVLETKSRLLESTAELAAAKEKKS